MREQDALDELVRDLVLHLLLVLPRHPAATLLAPVLLERRLVLQLERLRPDDLAVHVEHDIPSSRDEVGHLPVGEPADEGDDQDVEDGLRDLAHSAHHGGRDSGAERVEGA